MSVPLLLPPQVIEGAAPIVGDGISPVEFVGAGLLGAGIGAALGYAALGALAAGGQALIAGGLTAAATTGDAVAGGLGLLALDQLRNWGLLNWRPVGVAAGLPEGGELVGYPGSAGVIVLEYKIQNSSTGRVFCPTGEAGPNSSDPESGWIEIGVFAQKVRLTRTFWGSSVRCGPGSNVDGVTVPIIEQVSSTGAVTPVLQAATGGVSYNATFAGNARTTITGFRIRVAGVYQTLQEVVIPGVLPDPVRPLAPDPDDPDPSQLPDPPRLPPPLPRTLPPVPVLPLPALPQVPGGLPQDAARRAPRPGPARGPSPAPAVAPTVPGAVPSRPVGPVTTPAIVPVPVTPPSVVVVGGEPIGGPGQSPQATLQGIATEVGRLERKMEIQLERPQIQIPSDLARSGALETVADLVRQLIGSLLDGVPGGTYQLVSGCPVPLGQEPPEPVTVNIPDAGSTRDALIARLDALAQLLQVHKDLRQPMCKTAGAQSNVTVQFEEL
jgi:hypothetical protein